MMNEDNRSYFRIEDTLRLGWVVVDDNNVQSEADLQNELDEINERISSLISIAFQQSPVVGEALGLLNRKLDVLEGKTETNSGFFRTVRVNLSGAGIGFAWNEPAVAEAKIDLTMILKPSNVTVKIRADVLGCEPSNHIGEDWWIRAAFDDGQDNIKEQIIQHVSHRQTEIIAEQRRRQRLSSAVKDS